MIKAILSLTCFLLLCAASNVQSQVEYLQVTSEYSSGSGDSSEYVLTYEVSVSNYSEADSLLLSLTDGDEQVRYQTGNTLAVWKTNYPHRIEGSTLYLTIGVGTYAALGRFGASAHTVSGGTAIPGKSFGNTF